MPVSAKAATGRPQAARKGRRKGGKRKALKVVLPLLIPAWLALGHFLLRPVAERWIEARFDGDASVGWTVLWPDLDVTLFGVSLRSDRFRVDVSQVSVDVRPFGFLGSRPVRSVDVDGLRAEVVHGAPLGLVREPVAEGDDAPREGLDLDPTKVVPLVFRDTEVSLRMDGDLWSLVKVGRVDVRQVGDRTFAVDTGPGGLGRLPFEKLTCRLIPRADHVLMSDLKLRAFNGMIGGVIDLDTSHLGSVNGELEWHFVEIERIWDTYGLPYAEKRRGDLSGHVVFKGDRPQVEALSGTGTAQMSRARFFSPVGFRVFLTLKIPVAAESMLNSGEMKFSFENSYLYIEEARANAQGFHLDARGIVSFAGAADLEVGHAGTTVRVSGSLEDPEVKVLPLSGVTLPFDRLFREKVK